MAPKIAGWGEAVRRIYSLVQKTDQNTLWNLTLDSKELKEYIPLL
jgi:protein SERAC1